MTMPTRPAALLLALTAVASAPQEAPDVGPNRPDEPLAREFSADRAQKFLDAASLQWQRERKCMTCHTNYAYLLTAPERAGAYGEVRKFAEQLVADRWASKGPRWDAEVVMTALVLADGDARGGGKLHPLTRSALDRMWTVQKPDGGWNWLKCNWPPMESDDFFGATAALLAVGKAPEGYASTPAAQDGLKKLRAYLAKTPPPSLHHRAMVFWGSTYVEGVMSPEEQKKTVESLLALQRPDGGWSLATLGDWKRSDGKDQDTQASDGYGTGFVIYLARRGGVPASDERLRKGVEWLKTHQRESGRWFTRSLNKDNKHFITHAGTAFALLALRSCGVVE
jgi:squalene-hopene/tetraprenyl-beta-curcumene cyclase